MTTQRITHYNHQSQNDTNAVIKKFQQVQNGWYDKERHRLVFQKADVHLTVGKHRM